MGISMMVMFVVMLVRLFDGYAPAKYIFLGGVLSSMGFSIATLGSIGIIAATPATEAAGYAGIIAMSMLDAFALSYRMNMDRQLRQDIQAELIETQRQTNANLDRMVRERTENWKQPIPCCCGIQARVSRQDTAVHTAGGY